MPHRLLWVSALVVSVLTGTSAHAAPSADEPTGQVAPQSRGYDGPGAVAAHSVPAAEAGPGVSVSTATDPAGADSIAFSKRPPPPRPLRHRWVYKNLTALRYNPLGLVNEFTTGWRVQLFMKPGALYKDSFVGTKLHTFVSPAFARVGPKLEIQPLAILNLSATYDWVGQFGTFSQLMTFPTPTAVYDDDTIDKLGDAGRSFPSTGHMLRLAALLQAKVKNIAVRSNLRFQYADMDERAGDTVFYDQTLDLLHPDEGWVVVNDADVLYLFDFGLKVAARHTVTHAFYQKKHFLPGEPESRPNSPTHRMGPAILHTFYDKPERRFNKPTLFLLAQWWMQHRYRTGANVSAGVPYIAIGLVFEGDLLPDPRKRAKTKKTSKRR